MATVDIGARNNPPVPTEDLDDLFDYSIHADIFQDVNTDMEVPKRPTKAPLGDAGKEKDGGLGIDEEIKVAKKRAPVAKLDQNRLVDVHAVVLYHILNWADCCHLLGFPG